MFIYTHTHIYTPSYTYICIVYMAKMMFEDTMLQCIAVCCGVHIPVSPVFLRANTIFLIHGMTFCLTIPCNNRTPCNNPKMNRT